MRIFDSATIKHSASLSTLTFREPEVTLRESASVPSIISRMDRDNWRVPTSRVVDLSGDVRPEGREQMAILPLRVGIEGRGLVPSFIAPQLEEKHPDGSMRLLGAHVDVPVNFVPTPEETSGTSEEDSSGLDSSQELNRSLDRNGGPGARSYIPGRRCGIIPVDIRFDQSCRKVVSLLVVMGRPTVNDMGQEVNIWSFGKGRMLEEETEEECAIREFWEETGIRVATVRGMPRIVLGKNVYYILHTTREAMNPGAFAIKDTFEVQEVAWKTVEELRRIVANKDVRAVIRYPARTFPYHKLIFSRERGRGFRNVMREWTEPSGPDFPPKENEGGIREAVEVS